MVLIIEDDEDTRLAYQEFLELSGYDVAVAGTGAEGLQSVRERAVDAVLLDLTLPDIDGRDLCASLREAAEPRPLPIMALTAHSLTRNEQAKFSAVLRKPVDLDAVAVWLRVVSAAAQSAREHR